MTAVAIGIWLTMLAARGTPIGRMLHRWLVEKPAARLARITRIQIAVVLLLAAAALGAFWLIGHDGLFLYGMAAPELTGLLASVEMSAYLDAAIAVAVAASAMRWSVARAALGQRVRRFAGRTARARRVRPVGRAANDDEDGGAALAA